MTQSLLWIVLHVFFAHYLVALMVTEILIWVLESLALYFVPSNRLALKDALLLGLSMNLVSFGMGWFLPV